MPKQEIDPQAGYKAPSELLIDPSRLERDYYQRRPDPEDPGQAVSFGTSGHRGKASDATFNEAHILAVTQAICDLRQSWGVNGPLFMGRDSHALSAPAQRTALEVLAANGVATVIQEADQVTPTPVISRAILVHNQNPAKAKADGIIITPSHNPPSDGGFKYNPPHGGPADTDITSAIQKRANELLKEDNHGVKRVSFSSALKASTTREENLNLPYVKDLVNVVDVEAIRSAKVRIGVDPLGGASLPCWELVHSLLGLDLTIVNDKVDPRFAFMTLDHDGKIRMDCSSPYAMAGLIGMKNRFQIAFGNDPDADRHGIVTPTTGLMNPNHFLAVAIDYLLQHRERWSANLAVGKTVVSSSLIDRVVAHHQRELFEVPVGFKWFAPGLANGSICFGGEESAGASFLRFDGSAWTTDKDGLIMGLLAAEILARTGHDPSEHFTRLTETFGQPHYARIDSPATAEEKTAFTRLTAESVDAGELAGDPLVACLTEAPGNDAAIGGLKVTTASAWFAARPSGTEDLYKLYAESFRSEEHLQRVLQEAQQLLKTVLNG